MAKSRKPDNETPGGKARSQSESGDEDATKAIRLDELADLTRRPGDDAETYEIDVTGLIDEDDPPKQEGAVIDAVQRGRRGQTKRTGDEATRQVRIDQISGIDDQDETKATSAGSPFGEGEDEATASDTQRLDVDAVREIIGTPDSEKKKRAATATLPDDGDSGDGTVEVSLDDLTALVVEDDAESSSGPSKPPPKPPPTPGKSQSPKQTASDSGSQPTVPSSSGSHPTIGLGTRKIVVDKTADEASGSAPAASSERESESVDAAGGRAHVDERLEKLSLSAVALNLAAELMHELDIRNAPRRAEYKHAVAQAVRSSRSGDAARLAVEMDEGAIDLEPALLAAHQALVADAWRAGEWKRCTDRLGMLATQVEEMTQDEPRLLGALPSLYSQLELLLERYADHPEGSLNALCQHARELSQPQQLLAALNAARQGLATEDSAAVTAAYEQLVEQAPSGLREAFAIDLVTYLWRDRNDVRHAIAAYELLSGTDFRNPAHLAALQLLAWEGAALGLEQHATERWIEYLDDTRERLGRTDLARRQATTRRMAALHYRMAEIARTLDDEARARTAFDAALSLVPDGIVFNDELELRARRDGDADGVRRALAGKAEALESPQRQALHALARARFELAIGTDESLDAAAEHLARALEFVPTFEGPARLLRHLMLRLGRYEDLVQLERVLAEALDVDGTRAAIDDAERAEVLLDAGDAFERWSSLDSAEFGRNAFVLRALERTGLPRGEYDALAEMYGHALEAAESADAPAARIRAISWKRTQILARVLGPRSEAIEAFRAFLEREPNHVPTLDILADTLRLEDRFAEAVPVLESLIEQTEHADERRYFVETRASLLAMSGERGDLLDDALDELVALDADNACAQLLTRELHMRRGDWAALEAWCIERSKRKEPGVDPERDEKRRQVRLLEAAWVATTQGTAHDSGRAHLDSLLHAAPDWIPALDLHEEFFLNTGAWQSLVGLLRHRAGVEHDPEERARLLEQAASLAADRLDDHDLAKQLYRAALELRPDDPAAWREVLAGFWADRDFAGLAEAIEQRCEHPCEPSMLQVRLRERTFAAMAIEDTEQAEFACHPLVEHSDIFALRSLRRIYREQGDLAALFTLLDRIAHALERYPDDALQVRLAQWRLGQQFEDALTLDALTRLVRHAPQHPVVGDALDTWVHAGGEHRSAEEVSALVEVLDLRPPVENAVEEALRLEQHARLKLDVDDYEPARAALQAAVTLCPEHVGAWLAIIGIDDTLGRDPDAAASCTELAERLEPGPHRYAVISAAIQHWRASGETRRADQLQEDLDPDHEPPPGKVLDPTVPSSLEFILQHELAARGRNEQQRGLVHYALARLHERAHGGVPTTKSWPHWMAASRHLAHVPTIQLGVIRHLVSGTVDDESYEAVVDRLSAILGGDALAELYLALADQALAEDDRALATLRLETLLERVPGHREALERLAQMALDDGAIERATGFLARLAHVVSAPELSSAIALQCAWMLDGLAEKPAEAIALLESALARAPGDASLLFALAQLQSRTQQWRAAATSRLREAHAHDGPSRLAALYQAARLYGRRCADRHAVTGTVELAADASDLRLTWLHREIMLEAGERDPLVGQRLVTAARTPVQRARHCWLMGMGHSDPHVAVDLMREALHAAPDYILAALTMEVLSHQHILVEPLAFALAASADIVDASILRVRAGQLLEAAGDPEAAETHYRAALESCLPAQRFGPFGPSEVLRRHYARHDLGAQEIEHLFEMLELPMSSSRRLRLYGRVADLLMHEGRAEEAVDAWRAVLELDPRDVHARSMLDLLLSHLERHEARVESFATEAARIRARDGEWANALHWECALIAARDQRDLDRAVSLLEAGLDEDPSYRRFWRFLEQLLAGENDVEALVGLLQRDLSHAAAERQGPLAYSLGQLYEQAGADDAALEAYSAVLGYHDTSMLHHAARDAMATIARPGGGQQYVDALRELVEHEPDGQYRSFLALRLGQALERAQRLPEALPAYQRALESASQNAWAALAWERCCVSLGELETYDAWLDAAIATDPHAPHVVEFLARRVFIAPLDRMDDALERLLEREPEDKLGLLARFRNAATSHDYAALSEICQALALSTYDAAARQSLLESAVLFASVVGEDQALAEEPQWALLEGNPHNMLAILRLLGSLTPAQSPEKSARIAGAFANAARSNPEETRQLTTMAFWLALDGDLPRAAEAADAALERQPEHLPAICLRRQIADARDEFQILADVAVREANVLTQRGTAYERLMLAARLQRERLENTDEAIRLLQSILDEAPLHVGAFEALERIYKDQNMRSDLHDLVTARASHVDNITEQKKLLARAAEIARVAGAVQDAIDNWRQLIARDPEDLDSYRGMATFCLDNERWEDAVEALEELSRRSRDQGELIEVWNQLGFLLAEKLERAEDAIPVYRQLLRVQATDSNTLERLADLYERTAQYDKCLEVLEEMVPLQADIDDRKEVVARIFNGLMKWFNATSRAQEQVLRYRQLDSSDLSLLDKLVEFMRVKGMHDARAKLLDESYEHYRQEYLTGEGRTPLRSMQRIAKWQGRDDRAFVTGSLLVHSGAATESEVDAYKRAVRQAARRPERLDEGRLVEARSPMLGGALLDVMRQAEDFLNKSGPHMRHNRSLSRKYKVKSGQRAEVSALEPHVEAFGVEMPTVYVLPDPGEIPSLCMLKYPTIVLGESDLDANALPRTRFRVSVGAAALALGCAHFVTASFEEFRDIIVGLARAVLPNQTLAVTATDDDLIKSARKSVPRRSREPLSANLLQLAKNISDDTLATEYQALQVTCFRHALATMRDPAPGLDVITEIERSGVLPVGGTMRDILQYVVSDTYEALRESAGITS